MKVEGTDVSYVLEIDQIPSMMGKNSLQKGYFSSPRSSASSLLWKKGRMGTPLVGYKPKEYDALSIIIKSLRSRSLKMVRSLINILSVVYMQFSRNNRQLINIQKHIWPDNYSKILSYLGIWRYLILRIQVVYYLVTLEIKISNLRKMRYWLWIQDKILK